jgi:hypothetical protein
MFVHRTPRQWPRLVTKLRMPEMCGAFQTYRSVTEFGKTP